MMRKLCGDLSCIIILQLNEDYTKSKHICTQKENLAGRYRKNMVKMLS